MCVCPRKLNAIYIMFRILKVTSTLLTHGRIQEFSIGGGGGGYCPHFRGGGASFTYKKSTFWPKYRGATPTPPSPLKVREGRWAANFPQLCVFLNRLAISEHIQTYDTSN